MLTKETHMALKQTTYAMTETVSYCNTELGLNYVLPGKFQTDHLKNRFSLYRQLAGGQYHISMRQIFESEKKLRMQSSIKFCLDTKSGKVNVTDFNIQTNFKELCEVQDFSYDFPIMVNGDDIDRAKEKLPVIVYVGGYCVYSILKKLNCEDCRENMKIDKESNKHSPPLQFTMNLDSRELAIFSPKVVNIVLYTFIVVSKLCYEYDEKFLKVQNHKQVATNVTTNVLVSEEICYDFCSNHDAEKIVKMIVWATVNILLNNYCKERNRSGETCTKKRKLQVFSK